MMIFKKNYTNWKKIETFLESNCGNYVFYSNGWHEFLRLSKEKSPFIYGVEKDEGEIIAVIIGSIEFNFSWPINKLTSRSIIHGGPYVKNNDLDVLRFLLANYNKVLKHKAIYSQFRNNADMSWASSVFYELGYSYEPHLDIFIDLTQSQEDLTKQISRNKRRNVTKSLNKGAVVRQIENRKDYIDSLDLIYNTYKRIKLPLADSSFFINAFDQLHHKGILKCFGLYYNDICIGVRIELIYEDLIYDWFAGSDDDYKSLYANDVLPYHILLWAQEKNLKTFDFGGAGKPGVPYGVRDHKLKFGGELVEYGRFEKVHKKGLMKLGELGLRLYKLIK